MASSVPVVPAGVDPFMVYQQAIDDIFYRKPTAGFRARLYVLGSLVVSYTALALIYLILLCSKHKRRGGSRPWIAKWTNQAEGRFLVINLWIIGTFLALIQGAIAVFYIIDTGRIYLHRGGQKHTWALRSMQYVPMYLHGYIASAGILQGYTMLASAKGNTRWRPRTTSLILAVVGSTLLLLQLGTSIWTLLRGQKVWDTYVNISQSLQAGSRSWNGTVDYGRLLQLEPLVDDLTRAGASFTPAVKTTCLVLPLLPLSCLALNVSGLFLARRLHRNIVSRSSRLMRQDDAIFDGRDSSSPSMPTHIPAPPDRRGSVAMSVLRQLTVKDPEDNPSWQVQAQQALELLELRKAEGDLIVASTSIAVCAAVALAFSIYLTIFVFSDNYTSGDWPSLEAALLTIQWEISIVFVPSFAILIFNELHIRPVANKRTKNPERTPIAGFKGYQLRAS